MSRENNAKDLEKKMTTKKKTGGLAGVSAGATALCTVGKEGAGLTYRGYDIYDLADNASFEEVAYLLMHTKLPNQAELDSFIARIKSMRGLPDAVKQVLEMIPAESHPMDVLRSGVSILGNVEPEGDFSNQSNAADRLLACLPSMLLYWHHFHTDGTRIDVETDDDSLAGHFLHMLHGKAPSEMHRKTLDTTLILYAEHEFNASTFAARVITGTLSDMHSAVTGAIGALRGPLHGGANEAAMELVEKFSSAQDATQGVLDMLARKDKIMGFGHRVYTTSDPRDAFNLADELVLLHEHRVVQTGEPLDVYERPVNIVAADLMSDPGVNRLDKGGSIQLVRPEHLSLAKRDDSDSAFPATLLSSETSGSETFLHCAVEDEHWVARLEGLHQLDTGTRFTLYANRHSVLSFPGENDG